MNRSTHWGPISIWHHRALGGLWVLCALIVIGNIVPAMLQHDRWARYQSWIPAFAALTYIVTGIGFIFGRTWARRTMAILMVVAALLSVDMMLMAGFHSNRVGVLAMLIGAG